MEKKQLKLQRIRLQRILYLLILCFLVSGCCHKTKVMDHVAFQKIPDGSCFKLVTEKFGPPYDVILLRNGIKEYRYLQLTELAPGVVEQVHFIITVSYDGLIINKKAETVTATSEMYTTESPDYLLVPPDSLAPEFISEREIEGPISTDCCIKPNLFMD